MLTREQVEFLLELLRTKGIAFPLEKCRIAGETELKLLNLLDERLLKAVPDADSA